MNWLYSKRICTRLPVQLVLLVLFMLGAGCRSFMTPPSLPQRDRVVRDQLVIHTDFRLPIRHRLLEALTSNRDRLLSKLDLPESDESIHVYLFDDEDRFRKYLDASHPGLPRRRAFFVKNDTDLSVLAFWGEQVGTDLQHEVTHGFLHSVVPAIPLWLDEGLAEYFEVGSNSRGLNRPHLTSLANRFRNETWTPDLTRLEGLSETTVMTQSDYAESWLWVNFLLEHDEHTLAIVRQYLAQLRAGEEPSLVSAELAKIQQDYNEALIAHLAGLIAVANSDGITVSK